MSIFITHTSVISFIKFDTDKLYKSKVKILSMIVSQKGNTYHYMILSAPYNIFIKEQLIQLRFYPKVTRCARQYDIVIGARIQWTSIALSQADIDIKIKIHTSLQNIGVSQSQYTYVVPETGVLACFFCSQAYSGKSDFMLRKV